MWLELSVYSSNRLYLGGIRRPHQIVGMLLIMGDTVPAFRPTLKRFINHNRGCKFLWKYAKLEVRHKNNPLFLIRMFYCYDFRPFLKGWERFPNFNPPPAFLSATAIVFFLKLFWKCEKFICNLQSQVIAKNAIKSNLRYCIWCYPLEISDKRSSKKVQ